MLRSKQRGLRARGALVWPGRERRRSSLEGGPRCALEPGGELTWWGLAWEWSLRLLLVVVGGGSCGDCP